MHALGFIIFQETPYQELLGAFLIENAVHSLWFSHGKGEC